MQLGDIRTAIKLRETITQISQSVVDLKRPEDRIGKVYAYDHTTQTAQILFAGETNESLVTVHYSKHMMPARQMAAKFAAQGYNAPGDIVRVSGKPGSYWISDFIDGEPSVPAMMCNATSVQNVVTGTWVTINTWVYRYSHPDIIFAVPGNFIVKNPGIYLITFNVMFRNTVNSNGMRGASILHNGNHINSAYVAPIAAQGDYVNAQSTIAFDCPLNTSISFAALQTTGGTVELHTSPYTTCSMTRLGGISPGS